MMTSLKKSLAQLKAVDRNPNEILNHSVFEKRVSTSCETKTFCLFWHSDITKQSNAAKIFCKLFCYFGSLGSCTFLYFQQKICGSEAKTSRLGCQNCVVRRNDLIEHCFEKFAVLSQNLQLTLAKSLHTEGMTTLP